MKALGLSKTRKQVEEIMEVADRDGSGQIDIDEFIAVMCPSATAVVFKLGQAFKGKEGAAAVFKQIDVNGDGLLSKQEMSSATIGGSRLSKSEVDAIFKLGDVNGDGEIDMEEFLAVMVPSVGMSMSSVSSSSFSKTTMTSTSFSKTTVSSTSMCSVE